MEIKVDEKRSKFMKRSLTPTLKSPFPRNAWGRTESIDYPFAGLLGLEGLRPTIHPEAVTLADS